MSTKKTDENSARQRNGTRWSFAKGARFKHARNHSETDFVPLPSSFAKGRATGFGYGKRWEPRNAAGKDSPPVTRYSVKSGFDERKAGPVFGRIGRSVGRSRVPPSNTPGPGQYSSGKNIGDGGPKYTLKPRLTRVLVSETPSPDHYSPNVSVLTNRSYSNVTFGIGSRPALLHPGISHVDLSLPGPGTYNIPSMFKGRSFPRRLPSLI